METAHLKAFLRIGETGSISRAAESLGVAQPTLSQQLLRLEDEVGIRLFDRTARGVTLTEAGRIFLERARQILHATEQAIADTRGLRDEARGQVVFAMPPSVACLIGADLVQELARSAPLVHVRVVEAFTGSIRGWIEAEKIDLGILYDLGTLRHLTTQGLVSDELVVVGPRGRFNDGERPQEVELGNFSDETWIAPGRQHGLRQLFDAEVSRLSLDLRIGQEVDSIPTTINLVASGMGLAVLPRCVAVDSRWAGELSVARLGAGGFWRSLCLVRNPAHVLTHASVRAGSATRSVMTRLIAEGAWQARLENE